VLNSIFSFSNLLLNGGKIQKDWITLLNDIQNEGDTTEFVKNIQNNNSTNSNNELFLDVLDFIVDNCFDKTLNLINQDNFVNDFISPLIIIIPKRKIQEKNN
jgi:hypothetical protein